MQQIQIVSTNVLKPHPRNDEFFSDVDGKEFELLVESIKSNGILTPLRVTKDMVVTSGHQRLRAAKQIGLTEVPVIISDVSDDDDSVLMELIQSNFGRMKNDPVKQGKWIAEYEKLKGVHRGSNQHSSLQNNSASSQSTIAEELGVDKTTLQNLKRLTTLNPEIQDAISEGRISATTGFKIIARLSKEEQSQLVELLPDDVKLSTKKVQELISQISILKEEESERNKSLERDNRKVTSQLQESIARAEALEKELAEARSQVNNSTILMETYNDDTDRNEEICDLQSKLDTANSEIESLRKSLHEAQDKIDDGYLGYALGSKSARLSESLCTSIVTQMSECLKILDKAMNQQEIVSDIQVDFKQIIAQQCASLMDKLIDFGAMLSTEVV